MQKKLIALAVAAAFSAPAFADNSNVTVYGKLNADFENVQNDKAAIKSVTRVLSNASRFGVKGSEDLGDGLAAIWQLEAQFNIDGTGTAGFGGGTRNSNVGLKGNFGTVFLGNWDTPYKNAHNKNELFDNAGSFSSANIILGHAQNVPAANFTTRQTSDIQYWTPNLSGFIGKVSFASDTAQTATTAKKNRLSMSGEYENDMLYAALGYENRPAQTAASVTDTATRLVGTYKIDGSQIGLTYERLSVAATALATTASTQNNWELMGSYKFGNSTLGASYNQNGNLGAAANTGAKMATLRYGYNFSKRTEVYGALTELKNDLRASYSIAGGTANSKQTGFGLGMIHNF